MSMKNSNDTIGNQTHDLPACSAVPQPTALLCAPLLVMCCQKKNVHKQQELNAASCHPVLLKVHIITLPLTAEAPLCFNNLMKHNIRIQSRETENQRAAPGMHEGMLQTSTLYADGWGKICAHCYMNPSTKLLT